MCKQKRRIGIDSFKCSLRVADAALSRLICRHTLKERSLEVTIGKLPSPPKAGGSSCPLMLSLPLRLVCLSWVGMILLSRRPLLALTPLLREIGRFLLCAESAAVVSAAAASAAGAASLLLCLQLFLVFCWLWQICAVAAYVRWLQILECLLSCLPLLRMCPMLELLFLQLSAVRVVHIS